MKPRCSARRLVFWRYSEDHLSDEARSRSGACQLASTDQIVSFLDGLVLGR